MPIFPVLQLLLVIWLVLKICFDYLYEKQPKPLVIAVILIIVVLLCWFLAPFALRPAVCLLP